MRLSLWLILILAFSIGMCCAFALRFLYFEAMPVVVQAAEPTTMILVATRTIPSGIEITADFVAFQEVPISEVPPRILTCFAQVHRRQPAFPIPVGCPICEDMLLPHATTVPQTTFVPTGSQIVALDITHVRQGDRVFLPREPLSTVLADDQRIDIRVVLPETQGRLAEKRNEVLRAFSSQDIRNSGELVLENVPIHQIQRQFATNLAGSAMDSLKLMLETSEAARLTAAARRGQLRIFVRQDEMPMPPSQPSDIFEIAESPVQTLSEPLSLVQPLSLDVPHVPAEHSPPKTEADSAVPMEHVQRVAPVPAPAEADVFDPVLLPAATVATAILPLESAEEISQNIEQPSDSLAVFAPLELPVKEADAIRNEGMITFGASFRNVPSAPGSAVEQNPSPTRVSSLMDEPGQEALTRPHSELTAWTPRIANTIQFLPPRSIAPMREHSYEKTQQVESAIMSPVMPLIMPSAMPVPTATQERVPRYSPFERRIYTVLSSEDFGRSSGEELQAPQRLIRNSNSGTHTQ